MFHVCVKYGVFHTMLHVFHTMFRVFHTMFHTVCSMCVREIRCA